MNETKVKNKSNIALTAVIVTAIALIAAILSAATVIYHRSADQNKKEYTASYITSEVVRRLNYGNLSEISAANISKYYEIPSEYISDSSMYVSTRSDAITELACFKLTNKDYVDEMTEIVNAHIISKSQNYQSSGENLFSFTDNSKVVTSYPYLFVVISSDCDGAVTAFHSITT